MLKTYYSLEEAQKDLKETAKEIDDLAAAGDSDAFLNAFVPRLYAMYPGSINSIGMWNEEYIIDFDTNTINGWWFGIIQEKLTDRSREAYWRAFALSTDDLKLNATYELLNMGKFEEVQPGSFFDEIIRWIILYAVNDLASFPDNPVPRSLSDILTQREYISTIQNSKDKAEVENAIWSLLYDWTASYGGSMPIVRQDVYGHREDTWTANPLFGGKYRKLKHNPDTDTVASVTSTGLYSGLPKEVGMLIWDKLEKLAQLCA